MSFVRQPLLSAEVEARLKKEMGLMWRQGHKAKDIAEALCFGEEGTIFKKLKPYHVYFYRSKFGFLHRQKPPRGKGESRYKHKPKELGMMLPEVFINTLDEKIPKFPSTFHRRRKRTYLIIHYWTPLRKSEIYERTIEDFEITETKLIIHLLRKKKHHKPTDDDEPVSIPLEFPLMDEVIDWLESEAWKTMIPDKEHPGKTKLNLRPWKIDKDTAWNYVKEVFEDCYPHLFRFNWITDATDDPKTTIRELVAKTKLTLPALLKYIVTDEKSEESIDRRKLERIQAAVQKS
jgi:hypothetical protein